MTRDQALRQAQKRWGKRACVRANDAISSPELREAAKARQEARRAERSAIEAEIKQREAAAGIPALRQQVTDLLVASKADMWEASRYKFEAGNLDNIIGAFHIRAVGDTWEQVFAEADSKAKAS